MFVGCLYEGEIKISLCTRSLTRSHSLSLYLFKPLPLSSLSHFLYFSFQGYSGNDSDVEFPQIFTFFCYTNTRNGTSRVGTVTPRENGLLQVVSSISRIRFVLCGNPKGCVDNNFFFGWIFYGMWCSNRRSDLRSQLSYHIDFWKARSISHQDFILGAYNCGFFHGWLECR